MFIETLKETFKNLYSSISLSDIMIGFATMSLIKGAFLIHDSVGFIISAIILYIVGFNI